MYSYQSNGYTNKSYHFPAPKSTDIQSGTHSFIKPAASSPPDSRSSTPSYDVISNLGFDMSEDEMEQESGQTSWVMAAFLLINAALGAGLLNYPVAYDRLGGIAFATMIQIFAVFLMATTMMVLVYCAQINNETSYNGVMLAMCGRRVMQLAAGSITITCFGICVTFVIIIGDQFDRIFDTHLGKDFCSRWYANRYFTMLATSVVTIWPMCYFRRLDFLRHVNLLGVISSFYVIFLNIYTYYVISNTKSIAPTIRTTPDSTLEFVAALPVVFFAYQTHEIVIPVHASMSDRRIHAFSKATGLSLLILLILYCLAGTYGYLTFGSKVAPDIMMMYDADDPIVVAGIVAIVIKMVTTYPPVVFCGRDTIVRLLLSRKSKYQSIGSDNNRRYGSTTSASSSLGGFRNRKYHIWTTTLWNIIVLVLAIVTPNITVAIGFLGSLASCNVFIFPGLALISLARQYHKLRKSRDQQLNCHLYNDNLQHHQSTSIRSGDEPFIDDQLTLDSGNECRNNNNTSSDSNNYKQSIFSLTNRWMQILLLVYGAFIISMGVIMFIVILIQVYRDFREPKPHGVVCDAASVFYKAR